MLTADLVKPRLKISGGKLKIETLPESSTHWRQTADELIQLFAEHIGQTRYEWDAALENYEGERLDYVVIRGLAKVLCDAAEFSPIQTPLPAEELRQQIFAQGPVFRQRDLFQQRSRKDVIRDTAKALRSAQYTLEAALFADRPTEYILTDIGPAWTPDALISRYNLELARGVLYWASEMQIDIYDNYKDFWRYLKLFKLMFWAAPLEHGYHISVDGPISPFVKSTMRYGRQFAAFLPALLLGEKWHMTAQVRPPQSREVLTYSLDHTAPLTTHFKASGDFDSRLEADFAAEFHTKFGDERGDWILQREDEVILLGDTVMIPDFSFTHKTDGRRALLEIVGFWHPEYLRRKVEKVRAAGRDDLILLVYEGVNLTEDTLQDVPGEVLYFKNKPVLKDVIAAVERTAK